MKFYYRILLVVLSILILSSTACSSREDPRDAEIARLNTREDQLISVLTQQIADLKVEKSALEEVASNERYIAHLEGEEAQMRETVSAIAINSSVGIAGVLAGQNQQLQNSLVKLTGQQNQAQANLPGTLLDNWDRSGGYSPNNLPDYGYVPFQFDLPLPPRYNWSIATWEENTQIGDF
ncbi:MAG: hypothetical protein V1719_02505 [Patescibacteria group bacterium]